MKIITGDLIRAALLMLALFGLKDLNAQVYYFTNAGATGSVGPCQAQLNAAYLNTNLNNKVVSTNGVQSWTVPASGPYKITAIGAQGAGNGGLGAKLEGNFELVAGQVLNIVVGQQGESGSGANTSNNGGGGGGGSFIVIGFDSLLLAAGGGGGGILNSPGGNASTLTLGGSTMWNGAGDNGNGGHSGITNGDAAGGGGFYTDGENSYNTSQTACEGGKAFVNGASGGGSGTYGIYYGGSGGFGGGGAGWHNGINRGGAGGGYSGGQGGTLSSNIGGGGGGSFNAGDEQTNLEGVGSGNGSVVILFLKQLPVDTDLTGGGLGTGHTPTTAVTTAIQEKEKNSSITIYPNPTHGLVSVESNNNFQQLEYSIFDMNGKILEQKRSNEEIVDFDLSELAGGVYFLKVGDHKVQKIVKA